MTPHEKTIILIETFGYNSRQISEILVMSRQGADAKIKEKNGNRFDNENFQKLLLHFEKKTEKQSKVLRNLAK